MDAFDAMADKVYDDDLSKNEIAKYLRGEFMQYDAMLHGRELRYISSITGNNAFCESWIPFDAYNKPIESTPENVLGYLVSGENAVFMAFYVDGQFCMRELVFDNITHWMPMPKPPEVV